MNGRKTRERGCQFIVAWGQAAKLESTRAIRCALTSDGAANVQGHAHKGAARVVE